MSSHKILNIHKKNPALQEILSKELKISGILSQLLINRGITSAASADKFLNAGINHLLDPYEFFGMKKSVELIRKAVSRKEKIMICGDYDVDGITSVVLLKNTLHKFGASPLHYIPHRVREGYGLNKSAVDLAKENNIKLLITADCGSSNHDEVKELRKNAVEVIVTDHHEAAGPSLPDASAIINPKLRNCNYKFKELAGVGVAYKLCQALTDKQLEDELDLVTLGTIADVVPLVGENRIFAKLGLLQITDARRVGIRALIDVSRIGGRQINSGFVSFILGPRINASGRMASAETALKLLLSEDKAEADGFAKEIDALNRQRQKVESQIIEEAQDIINREINFKDHQVIVVAKEGWHQGVLGIVASKLADRFYRPTIVISMNDKFCKGSGRSIKSFHLFQALLECKDYLENFGGHAHAVGLLVTKDNIEDFKKEINRLAKEKLKVEDLLPSIDIDMEISLGDLSYPVSEEIKKLEPFGTGNAEPLFLTRNLRLKGQPQALARETLKFWVTDGSTTYPAIGFGLSSFRDSLMNAQAVDIVYNLKIDSWRKEDSLILEVKDIFFK